MIIYNRTKYKELTLKSYQKEKRRLQIELLKLQEWVIQSGKRLAIVFEGMMLLFQVMWRGRRQMVASFLNYGILR